MWPDVVFLLAESVWSDSVLLLAESVWSDSVLLLAESVWSVVLLKQNLSQTWQDLAGIPYMSLAC